MKKFEKEILEVMKNLGDMFTLNETPILIAFNASLNVFIDIAVRKGLKKEVILEVISQGWDNAIKNINEGDPCA